MPTNVVPGALLERASLNPMLRIVDALQPAPVSFSQAGRNAGQTIVEASADRLYGGGSGGGRERAIYVDAASGGGGVSPVVIAAAVAALAVAGAVAYKVMRRRRRR